MYEISRRLAVLPNKSPVLPGKTYSSTGIGYYSRKKVNNSSLHWRNDYVATRRLTLNLNFVNVCDQIESEKLLKQTGETGSSSINAVLYKEIDQEGVG